MGINISITRTDGGGDEGLDAIVAALHSMRSLFMATMVQLRDSLVQLVDTQNQVIAAKDQEIQQLRTQLTEAGLPDDQVQQTDVTTELQMVQEQQQRLEQILAEELEGESPEGEQVVIQPVVPEGETVFQPTDPTAGGGASGEQPPATGTEGGVTAQPATGEPVSEQNTRPAPDNPAAPPTEQQGGTIGAGGGGTAPEPMT
jgi:hypothetical protein